jgi:hypothetical protein
MVHWHLAETERPTAMVNNVCKRSGWEPGVRQSERISGLIPGGGRHLIHVKPSNTEESSVHERLVDAAMCCGLFRAFTRREKLDAEFPVVLHGRVEEKKWKTVVKHINFTYLLQTSCGITVATPGIAVITVGLIVLLSAPGAECDSRKASCDAAPFLGVGLTLLVLAAAGMVAGWFKRDQVVARAVKRTLIELNDKHFEASGVTVRYRLQAGNWLFELEIDSPVTTVAEKTNRKTGSTREVYMPAAVVSKEPMAAGTNRAPQLVNGEWRLAPLLAPGGGCAGHSGLEGEGGQAPHGHHGHGSPDGWAAAPDRPWGSSAETAAEHASWEARADPQSGRTYYWNLLTAETTWVRPKAAVTHL